MKNNGNPVNCYVKKSLFLLLFLYSCSLNTNKDNTKNIVTESNGLIKVYFNNTRFILWNKINNKILEDSNYIFFLHDKSLHNNLIQSICDTNNLKVQVCFKEKELKKGDIAYIMLDRIYKIPLFNVFNRQFDAYNLNCEYPIDLFNYIENNRLEVKNKLMNYL